MLGRQAVERLSALGLARPAPETAFRPSLTCKPSTGLPDIGRCATLAAAASVFGDRKAGSRLICLQFQAIRTDADDARD